MHEHFTYFITWTTYGTWLLRDRRGWRKANKGEQQPQPFLEKWCRKQLNERPVLLNEIQRNKVETICYEHAKIRSWMIHGISVRTNHIHVVVTADTAPKNVRDQFKANATRVLRQEPEPVMNSKIWTRGGDIEFIDDVEDNLDRVIFYINEAQDRKGRDQ